MLILPSKKYSLNNEEQSSRSLAVKCATRIENKLIIYIHVNHLRLRLI